VSAGADPLALIEEKIAEHCREIERLETARAVIEELSGRPAKAKPFVTIRRVANGQAEPKQKRGLSKKGFWQAKIVSFLADNRAEPLTSKQIAEGMGLDKRDTELLSTALWNMRTKHELVAVPYDGPQRWAYSLPKSTPPPHPDWEDIDGNSRE